MPQQFHNQVEQLRSQFCASLTLRARRLDEIWSHLQHLNWSEEGVKALQQFAHKLAGSGASFGLPELSQSAQELDSYINDLLVLERGFGGQERTQLAERITHLKTAMLNAPQAQMASTTPILKPEPILNDKLAAQSKAIFLIDPDPSLSALLCVYLREAGFRVEYFETPQDCIQHLYLHTPQAILMDLDFEHSGLQALTLLQQIKALVHQQVPILLMSARTDVNAKLRALRAGSSDYLTKPLDFHFLIAKLHNAINQHEKSHRVMIVDDDSQIANYQAEFLRAAGMQVLCVNKPLLGLQRAAEFKPDLLILDMHMPDMNGMELAILVRQDPQFFLLPIIFVTSDTDTQQHKELKALGINGLLLKPVEGMDLISACEQALQNTYALKNRIARVTQRSQQPQQTTRSYFFAALNHELQNNSFGKDLSALYYLSISHLDELSQQYNTIEQLTLHEQLCHHLSAIIGSDELWVDLSTLVICVLASKRSPGFHQQRSAQLVKYLLEQDYKLGATSVKLDINLSITHLNPALGSANHALIQAERSFQSITKENPGHKDPESVSATYIEPSKIEFKRDLRLAFQPIISLEDAHIDHFLVLTRLRREDGELLPAAQFLSRFTQPERYVELDRWVLQEAVTAISNNSNTREDATLFIHLAEETLQQSAFFSFVANVLRSSRLRGNQRLIFMLEEQWVLNNLAHARKLSKTIATINCGLCLTRAGSQAQSIELLQELEIHYVRLAPELIKALETNPQLEAYVNAANQSNVIVIATQIEDSLNLSNLWALGVRLFEGFFIQPPDSRFHMQTDIDFAGKFTL